MSTNGNFREIAMHYDVFFIDQFGVLHDGVVPYPGAVEALGQLTEARKTIVILSNSGKSGETNARRLERIGISRSSYTHFVTSGDVATHVLSAGWDQLELPEAPRCLTISSDKDDHLAKSLEFPATDDPDKADLVIIAGSQADRIGLEGYRHMLAPAARRGVPAVCTNPDIDMITPKGLAPAAGAIARLYEEMGGAVTSIGKPHAPIYRYAHDLCGQPMKSRVLAVGDSVDHDAVGARNFGVSVAILRQGISEGRSVSELVSDAQSHNVGIDFVLDSLA